MGNYLTEAQARSRFESIFNVYIDVATGREDESWLTEDIENVQADIDSRVAMRYTAPVTNTGGINVLRSIAIKLLHVAIYARMPGGIIPDGISHEGDNARRDLAYIAQGKISLGNEAPEENEDRKAGYIVSYNTPEMTRAKLKGF